MPEAGQHRANDCVQCCAQQNADSPYERLRHSNAVSADIVDASAMVPLVRAKKLAPWLLPPHLAALAAAGADAEPAKLQLTCADPANAGDPR